jgi:hypothetical protein
MTLFFTACLVLAISGASYAQFLDLDQVSAVSRGFLPSPAAGLYLSSR